MYIKEDELKLNSWQFSQRKFLPYKAKVRLSQERICEWYEHFGGSVYVSYSGGLDSTVLLHLVRNTIGEYVPAVFCNTGIEFPEIVAFARKAPGEYTELYPTDRVGKRIAYSDVLLQYGYPLISKETSMKIRKLQHGNLSDRYRNYLLYGDERGTYGRLSKKWHYLISAPFDISEMCCEILKKRPFKKYAKKEGRAPFIGITQDEGFKREHQYAHTGCNVYGGNTVKSQPLGFWTKQDILNYIVENDLEICSVYGDILQDNYGQFFLTGEQRTGCMYCAMGVHLEKGCNRFQRMQKTNPERYDYCMRNTVVRERKNGLKLYQSPVFWNWQIEADIKKKIAECGPEEFYRKYETIKGLGMAQILEYIGVPYAAWK